MNGILTAQTDVFNYILKLRYFKKYLTYDKKQILPRSEVLLYEWIIKRIEKDKFGLTIVRDEKLNIGYLYVDFTFRKKSYETEVDKSYMKQQNKYRARHHAKMGR